MKLELRKHARYAGPAGPVVLVVLDGIGIGQGDEADAVKLAATPTLDRLWIPGVRCQLRAHGKAVGLPSDADMGNSEVGHNALGAGRVYDQGAKLIDRALAEGSIWRGQTWQAILARCAGGEATEAMIGALFKTHDKWAFVRGNPVPELFKIAQQAGFTQEKFDACLKDNATLDKMISARQHASEEFGVNATPSFFINGKRLRGRSDTIEAFDTALAPFLG